METLKRTSLYQTHLALGARMVPFGGWEMPIQYSGIKDEHLAVRSKVALFDVSHMGEFEVTGPRMIEFVNYLCANDVTKLGVGRAHYSMFLNEQGGTIDDIIVYRLAEQQAMIVVNAGNIDKDWAHVKAVAAAFDGVMVENKSDFYGLLAIQGPLAEPLVNELVDIEVCQMPYYGLSHAKIGELEVILARTGYTGEDGFELFVAHSQAPSLWASVMTAGNKYGLIPAGLGARDTLRLEASMPLYGHELDENTSPLEAGLGYFVAKSGDYIGAARQREWRHSGLRRQLVMLKVMGRGIAREGCKIFVPEGEQIGIVTSGTLTPYLNEAIAQGYVTTAYGKPGTIVNIESRGKIMAAQVVKRPFYKRKN